MTTAKIIQIIITIFHHLNNKCQDSLPGKTMFKNNCVISTQLPNKLIRWATLEVAE
jgi:hypothetical protein